MDIYIGNIPKGTRPAELRKWVRESFRNHIFEKIYQRMISLGRFEHGMAVNIKKRGMRGGGRYGRIRFHSQRMADFALEVLEGTPIRGSDISVRPYIPRHRANDRRKPGGNWVGTWNGVERRRKERRKH